MAQKKTLSDALLETLKAAPPGKERVRVLDTRLPGFLVEVSSRHKRFVVRSRGHYKTLGQWPILTVQEARIAALEFLRELALGKYVKRDKREGLFLSHRQDQSPAAPPPPASPEWTGPTLRAAIEEYVGVKRLKDRTASDYQQCLGRYWGDYLERPLSALDGNRVLDRFRTIQSHAQANYSLRIIRAVVRFHNAAHDDTLPIPTAKVLALEGAHNITPRSRLIPDDKQRPWYLAIKSNTGPVAGDLFVFLACTGLRLGEALSLTWADINLASKSLTVKDTKNGKPHSLPLGRRIAALLEGRQSLGSDDTSVVFHINQRNVRKAVSRVITACPVPWSSHDLRRGLVSLAVRLNIPDRAVKRLVNHSERDVTGRHYVHLGIDALRPYVQSIEDALWEMWETGVEETATST
ncbi:MAG: hypothetical protein A2580_07500 [Hydrogenophilales bacterium RIFOXYD1_FULL_62_11]|nr:MAG: hypothetical protein A2580_07500 [Hydrogenophilales bacterium RIFOXYD1_FULL_62_11]